MIYELIVVGAGPAGLAAARARPGPAVCLIDAGPCIATRRASFDGTVVGAGGASLCNDGKLSFGTAGTALKWLPARWCTDAKRDLLRLVGLDASGEPTLARGFRGDATPQSVNDTFETKRYPSVKTSAPQRLALIKRIEDDLMAAGAAMIWDTLVLAITWDASTGVYVVRTRNASGALADLYARSVVNCTGRVGPLALKAPVTTFRRLSFGALSRRICRHWGLATPPCCPAPPIRCRPTTCTATAVPCTPRPTWVSCHAL